MERTLKIGKRVAVVLERMRRRHLMLVRQALQAPEAIERGGGYLYATYPDDRTVSPAVGKFLIDAGIVASKRDDLFGDIDGGGQVYILANPLPPIAGLER